VTGFWDAPRDAEPGRLTPELLRRAADAIRDAPPHPCSLGQHVVHPDALYRPGTYVCGSCGGSVDVPFPLSERT
jgi:hypothetical protein